MSRATTKRLDCVLVGYSESDLTREDLALALERPDDTLPRPIRSLLRTTLLPEGYCSCLDGLSAVRTSADHEDDSWPPGLGRGAVAESA